MCGVCLQAVSRRVRSACGDFRWVGRRALARNPREPPAYVYPAECRPCRTDRATACAYTFSRFPDRDPHEQAVFGPRLALICLLRAELGSNSRTYSAQGAVGPPRLLPLGTTLRERSDRTLRCTRRQTQPGCNSRRRLCRAEVPPRRLEVAAGAGASSPSKARRTSCETMSRRCARCSAAGRLPKHTFGR